LLQALAEASAETSPRWQWQREGAAERALTPELHAWLQRLDRAVAGRWSGVDPGQESAAAQAQGLRLLHDGGLRAIVRLGPDGRVRIDIAGEAPLVAQLPPASAAALQWSSVIDHEQLQLEIRNTGSSHAQISGVALAPPEGAPVDLVPGLLGYVLPGAAMHWTVSLPAGANTANARVKALINGEPTDQTLSTGSHAR